MPIWAKKVSDFLGNVDDQIELTCIVAMKHWNRGIGDKLVKILGIPEINGKVGEEENGGAAGQLQRHALKNWNKN